MKNNEQKIRKISKFLSLILRHQPAIIGIVLDEYGWVEVEILLQKMAESNRQITIDVLRQVVANNDKKRFTFNDDGTKIRANQGHSIAVNLDLPKQIPPKVLYHGTAQRFINSIQKQGLQKRNRQHVHLSDNIETATMVGKRHGEVVVLEIAAEKMHRNGFSFFLSKNGVWLTHEVPPAYIEFRD